MWSRSEHLVVAFGDRAQALEIPGAGQDLAKVLTDLGGGEHKVDAAGFRGRGGHSVVFRRAEILGDGDAAGLADRLHAVAPVAAGARKHDSHACLAALSREAHEQSIPRGFGRARFAMWRNEGEQAVLQHDIPVRWCDINGVGCWFDRIAHFDHVHVRLAPDQRRHQALVGWRHVLCDDITRARIRGKVLDKLRERLEAPGGGSNADDESRVSCHVDRPFWVRLTIAKRARGRSSVLG